MAKRPTVTTDIDRLPLAQVRTIAAQVIEDYAAHPSEPTSDLDALDRLIAVATCRGLTTLGQLRAELLPTLADRHGVEVGSVMLAPAELRGEVYRSRNMLLAATLAAARHTCQHPAPFVTDFPTLAPLGQFKGRAMTDDELLCTRLYRLGDGTQGDLRDVRSALVHVSLDSGACAYEASLNPKISTSPDGPTITLPGIHTGASRVAARNLMLDEFNTNLYKICAERLQPRGTVTGYTGDNNGSAAAASVHRQAQRLIARLGLGGSHPAETGSRQSGDLQAISIANARLARELAQHGEDTASRNFGIKPSKIYDRLGIGRPAPSLAAPPGFNNSFAD